MINNINIDYSNIKIVERFNYLIYNFILLN